MVRVVMLSKPQLDGALGVEIEVISSGPIFSNQPNSKSLGPKALPS